MPFPKVNRIIYQKNPLKRVICQLRFPPILKIDAETPEDLARFQDKIRKVYPEYNVRFDPPINLPADIRDTIPPEIVNSVFPNTGGKNHEFISEDGRWKVNLTRTFLSLSTHEYDRWESFQRKLDLPLQALLGTEAYRPAYFTRIGLRYIDVIDRSELGLEHLSWDSLLNPAILGILATEMSSHVRNYESRNELTLSDQSSTVRMVTKLQHADDGGEVFVIDNDFFTSEKVAIDEVANSLEYFRLRGSRLFQWCITEELHKAMEPEAI